MVDLQKAIPNHRAEMMKHNTYSTYDENRLRFTHFVADFLRGTNSPAKDLIVKKQRMF